MKESRLRTEGLKKDNSKTEGKVRRISQRKEVAVVTLGMVAAITGVGGLLAASPPSGVALQTTDTGNGTPAIVQADHSPNNGKASEVAGVGSDSSAIMEPESVRGSGEVSKRDDPAAQVASQPAPGEEPVQTPSWSSSSQHPASTKSRGS